MDARQERGLVIAATKHIVRIPAHQCWGVPSQTASRIMYRVRTDGPDPTCTCPDYELRGQPCKHVYAVEFFLQRETAPDGTVTETRAVRLTYGQNWPAYNAAQTTEKAHFCRLLHALCAGVPEPAQTRGRPRLPLADMLFAAAFKVYSTQSARRFMTDLRHAAAEGYLQRAPHFNSIFHYLERESLTPIIHTLITESSLPLQAVETAFAVDSTGFGLARSFNYYDGRYGKQQMRSDWMKLHAMVGVKTNVVTSATVTGRHANDSPEFVPLVEATAKHFTIEEVSADKAYGSVANLTVLDTVGATPYIAFKARSRGDGKSALWNKAFHAFALHREEFAAHYHLRSNVESTFSAMKRVFGDAVRSKTPVAQVNEVLLKVLCHNIRCLVHAIHELGVTPMFGLETGGAEAC